MRASLPPGNNLASKLLSLTSLHFLRLGSHFMPIVALLDPETASELLTRFNNVIEKDNAWMNVILVASDC